MSEPRLDWMFPVPVFQHRLEDDTARLQAVVEALLTVRASDHGVKRSNIGGWHSSDLREFRHYEAIDWVLERVTEFTTRCLRQLPGAESASNIALESAWAIVNERGQWNTPHNHLPSQWSGVLYLQVPEQPPVSHNGNLVIQDPHPLGLHYKQPINAFIAPRNGGIFLFPAYLVHMVEPHDGDEERIVLAFNANVVG